MKDTIAEPADRQETCSVATCERPRYRTDRYCGSHGAKLRRYGDPEWVRPTRSVDLAGMRFGSLVAIDRHDTTHWNCECDCGARTVTRTWCLTSGRAESCGDGPKHRRKDRIKYLSMHARITKERGRAGDHPCFDCGGLASQWSYDHLDPDELYATGMSVNPIAYSMEISHYEARCIPCHKRYDLDRINAYKASK